MLNLTYIINDKKYDVSESDNNIIIEIKKSAHREKITVKALNDLVLNYASNSLDIEFSDDSKFFLNGYQSWTDTKECYLYEKEKIARRAKRFFKKFKKNDTFGKTRDLLLNRFAFDRYGDVLSYDYSTNKLHGYDIFYIKGKKEFFSYNYNFRNAYLVYEILRKERKINVVSDIKKLHLKKGEEFTLFDYSLFGNNEEGLNGLYELYPYKYSEKIFGYTSWYNYYQNINEEIILRDLEGLDSRFNLFQIDDGYETFVGDWLDIDKKKFPNGLDKIVAKVHSNGYKAGIWLAPFAAETNSKLFKEHKDWFLKDKKGNPILAGGNWSKFYALDYTKEEVRNYIKTCLEYYMNLGFDFFKLDFLYAAALTLPKGKSRCQTQKEAYQFLRDILKDKIILGCGANIINSYRIFDYLRIGPDVSLKFDDVAYMRLFHRERISTKVTLQNTIYRHLFDQHLFGNDPDVFLLRDENIELSKEQRKALTLINALMGSVLMTSDNIATYDEEKKLVLDKAFNLFYKAKVIKIKRNGSSLIDIDYEMDNKINKITYDWKKGVLVNHE